MRAALASIRSGRQSETPLEPFYSGAASLYGTEAELANFVIEVFRAGRWLPAVQNTLFVLHSNIYRSKVKHGDVMLPLQRDRLRRLHRPCEVWTMMAREQRLWTQPDQRHHTKLQAQASWVSYGV